MNFVKFLTTVLIIVACATLANSKRRQKRTLGTILQFFGYRIVPIMENKEQQSLSISERIRSPIMNRNQRIPTRIPEINRIQTVMPFVEIIETTTQVSKMTTSSSKMPVEPTSTEAPTEGTTVNVSSGPLRIIMEEMSSDPTEASSVMPSSTTENNSNEKLRLVNSSATSGRLEDSTMSARLELSTPLPNIAALPLDSSNVKSFERPQLDSLNVQSFQRQTLDSSNVESPEPKASDSPPVRSFVRVDPEANQRRINALAAESNQEPVRSFVRVDAEGNSLASDQMTEQNNNNIEILRSDDVSTAYFDAPTFPVYESFPPYIQAKPFSLPHDTSYLPQYSYERSDYTPSDDYTPTINGGEYLDIRSYK